MRAPPAPSRSPGSTGSPRSTRSTRPQRGRRRRPSRLRTIRGVAATVVAAVLLWLALVVPDDARHLSPTALLRVPVEGAVLAAVLLALPARATRAARVIAWTAGALLGVVVLLTAADHGFQQVLDRPAHVVTDWRSLGNGLDYVTATYGRAAAVGVASAAVVVAVGLPVLLGACSARVGSLLRRHRGTVVRPLGALVAAWTILALLDVHLVAGEPVAARNATTTAVDHLGRARSDLEDQALFARQLSADPAPATGSGELLAGLRGKDVVVVFVESYGRTAVEDPGLAPGLVAALDAGSRDLRSAGFSARSGFLTSSTFGGRSWLAHSTLLSGAWVDSQTRYDQLLARPRPTLVSDFERAGWRTVVSMPGTGEHWPDGSRFYGYDTMYISQTLGYRGPAFSWSPMPDQFVLAQLQRQELAAREPVMAVVELTSSHSPWAPLPSLVPWDKVGDGTVFAPMPGQGKRRADVWKDPALVRAEYGRAVQYSVSTVLSFVQRYGTEDTVVVVLGDHQPIKAVTGDGASHDVPVAVIAKDPAVIDSISSWGWSDGVRPARDAPVWRMDTFRDRFRDALERPAAR